MKGLASRAIASFPGRAAKPSTTEAEQQRLRMIALSRSENEDGASLDVPQASSASGGASFDDPAWARTEAEQLRIRVIALKNLVIALLAQALESHRALAREMTAYISPRPGCTPHPLAMRAADEMLSLVNRAGQFRVLPEA